MADDGKGHKRGASGLTAAWIKGFVKRRHWDILMVPSVVTSKVVGYVYVTQELFLPPDALAVQAISHIAHVLFALLVMSWLGVVCYGPGRVPKAATPGSKLPAAVQAALEVGRCAPERKFNGQDGWCDRCDCWKPVLAHHCKICDCCSIWMDHHCNFTGQCVGFRNLKCFVLFLIYGSLLFALLLGAWLRRLALPPSDYFIIAKLWAFLCGLVGFSYMVHLNLHGALWRISCGWPSWVLLDKFRSIKDLAEELDEEPEGELRLAAARTKGPSGMSRGLWHAEVMPRWSFVFGGPPNLLWLLPTPGGMGDPLRPQFCDASACEAWAALGELLNLRLNQGNEAEREDLLPSQRAAGGDRGPEAETIGSVG